MDVALISGLMTTLTATYEIGKTAVSLRDANKLAVTVTEMNDKIFQAQQSLFALMQQSMAVMQDLADAKLQNEKMKATIEQRGRYTLVELAKGNFALRSKGQTSDDGAPVDAEPVHYVCQPCFDFGRKSVLVRESRYGSVELWCALCDKRRDTGEREPYDF